MSYNPVTDFLALLRSTSGGVRTERMPGLDYVISALARAGLITVSVGQTAPIANQATTVWFQPAVPSWNAEGVVWLWNSTLAIYQVATPTLWSLFLAGPFLNLIPAPGNANPLVDSVAAPGVSLLYSRQDHVHPTDLTRAAIASPVFTGAPQAPTPSLGDNSANIATTAFVQETAGVVPTIGVVIAYAGNTAPNTSWLLAQGQAISRTTYANLFAILGITYGSGDGVTTFNIPDLRGRAIAGVDGGANRLTTATMTSQLLGGTSIATETKALATANLPAYTPAGTVSTTVPIQAQASFASTSSAVAYVSGGPISATSTFTGSAQGGTATAFPIVQPTMELQYLLRVL